MTISFQAERKAIRSFLLPDEAVSLKLIFDNIRNYIICAALLAAANHLSPSPALHSGELMRTLSFVLGGLAIICTLLNLLQSYCMFHIGFRNVAPVVLGVAESTHSLLRPALRVVLKAFLFLAYALTIPAIFIYVFGLFIGLASGSNRAP
jgi:hypothetical protein